MNTSPPPSRNVGSNYSATLRNMANDDWYRRKTWDNEIATDFEMRLKRFRGAFNKAQYLRIQASYLLGSANEKNQLVGLNLMERLIKELPTEEFSVIFGLECKFRIILVLRHFR